MTSETSSSGDGLQSGVVGKRKPLNDTIYLAPYNPAWPAMFSELADRVRDALSEQALLLEHVGSTSVEGLSAKPIIDMLLAVADSSQETTYLPPLEATRFTLRRREPEWFEHRLLKSTDIKANLHVFSRGCPEIDRMLAFRDWLRANPEDRLLYEDAKRKLAAQTWGFVQDYADAKTEIVEEILGRARRGAGTSGAE